MNLDDRSFDHSVFSKNRDRLLEHEVSRRFFDGVVERDAALAMVDRIKKKRKRDGVAPRTLGADKGYHAGEFVRELHERKIKPHLAMVEGRKTAGLDERTTRSVGYRISQRIRKRVEEIFGWLKTVGGFRKSRFRGLARFGEQGLMTAAAYNLMRISRMVT